MVCCCVVGCPNTSNCNSHNSLTSISSLRSGTASFHRFPSRERSPLRHRAWLQNVNRGATFAPSGHARVCSDHFRAEDFEASAVLKRRFEAAIGGGRVNRLLKGDAVPSLNLAQEAVKKAPFTPVTLAMMGSRGALSLADASAGTSASGSAGSKGAPKRTRRSYSISDKVHILDQIRSGIPKKQLKRELGLAEGTIRGWFQEEAKLRSFLGKMTQTASSERKRTRRGNNTNLDDRLHDWFVRRKGEGGDISRTELRGAAHKIVRELNLGYKFLCSDGWIHRWQKRYGIKRLREDFVTDKEMEQTPRMSHPSSGSDGDLQDLGSDLQTQVEAFHFEACAKEEYEEFDYKAEEEEEETHEENEFLSDPLHDSGPEPEDSGFCRTECDDETGRSPNQEESFSEAYDALKTESEGGGAAEEGRFVLEGCRIVDLGHVIGRCVRAQFGHSRVCPDGKMAVSGEKRTGLLSHVTLSCDRCGYSVTESTEREGKLATAAGWVAGVADVSPVAANFFRKFFRILGLPY